MTTSELGLAVEAELKVLRKQMRRALKAGDVPLYTALKAEHVELVHREQRRAQRAVRDAQRAVVVPVSPEEERRVADRVEEDRRWRKVIGLVRGGRAERYW